MRKDDKKKKGNLQRREKKKDRHNNKEIQANSEERQYSHALCVERRLVWSM